MRYFLSIFFVLVFSGIAVAQSHAPLEPAGKIPSFFYNPSHQLVNAELAKRNASGDPVDAQEEAFIREMSYFAQQRMISGIVLFNDSLSDYVSKVAAILLKDDTATFHKLHFYVYKSPDPNAYTSATGNILITVGLLGQLENEAQLAFILAHEITHYRQKHMLKGYLNREDLKERSGNTPSYLLQSSYYSYNQEQELEADQLGFELYKKSPYSVKEALRSFDVLDYSDLPFDDVPFDTTFFNKNYMTIPAGYFMKEVDPIYSDDNYEDRNSTHPNVRKRRMALMTEVDTVKNAGTHLFAVSKDEFLRVRELSRYEICRLYLIERNYPGAIYSAYMLLQRHPTDIYLQKIIGHSLYNISAYNQSSSGGGYYNPYLFSFSGAGGRYSALNRTGYYRIPDFKDYPGQQQQIYHLFHEIEPDELTILALSYNWTLHKKDPNDIFQKQLCDSLFIMLVNKQNLHLSYFSTLTPDEAKEQFRKDSLQRVTETGETGDSKYSRMDKFKLNSQKERFTKFAFVEMLKDTEFVHRFKHYTDHRSSLVSSSDNLSYYDKRSKEQKEQDEKDEECYGFGIQKIIVVSPDYEIYKQAKRKTESEQDFAASEVGQQNLGKTISAESKNAGVDCIMMSPFGMDSLDGDTFSDLAALNEWFFERMQHGSGGYAATMNNQAQIDSIISKYGTRYVMFTMVETEYRKKIQHPFWFGVSCLVVVPVIRAFIPRNNMSYDVAVLDLKTGEVVSVQHQNVRKGKEPENTSSFYKKLFQKMHKVKKPKSDGKPVTEAERGM